MDFKKGAQSPNIVDRTGWTPEQRKMHEILTLLNPALAAIKAHDWLQANGWAPIRSEVDFRNKR